MDPERLYATLAAWLPANVPCERPGTQPAAPAASVAAAPARPLQDRLADIDGLDAPRAWRLVGRQPALLRRVLDTFVSAYGRELQGLDAEQAPRMRGSCAAIGATRLEADLLAYEQALAGGTTPAGLQAQATDLLRRVRGLAERIRGELGH